MIDQLSKHPGKPIYSLWHMVLGFTIHYPLFFKINMLYKDVMEKEMATHSSILAWRIPWTEKPGRLQSMGSQRVGHDWVTSLHFPGIYQSNQKLADHSVIYSQPCALLHNFRRFFSSVVIQRKNMKSIGVGG